MFSAKQLIMAVAAALALSLTLVAAGPAFEVASVRACQGGAAVSASGPKGGGGAGASSSPVTLNLPCMPVRFFITLAFIISDGRRGAGPSPLLEGGPAWIDSDRYRITAKASEAVGKDMMNGPMLRALLEERFRLQTHRESREIPVYLLTVARTGLKLPPSDGSSCIPRDPAQPGLPPGEKPWCGVLRGTRSARLIRTDLPGGTMMQFAQALGQSGRMVVDKTEMTEKFDFHLEYAPEGADTADDAAPSVFAALGRLGLKLEPAKGLRDFVVIDHIERPSGN